MVRRKQVVRKKKREGGKKLSFPENMGEGLRYEGSLREVTKKEDSVPERGGERF